MRDAVSRLCSNPTAHEDGEGGRPRNMPLRVKQSESGRPRERGLGQDSQDSQDSCSHGVIDDGQLIGDGAYKQI